LGWYLVSALLNGALLVDKVYQLMVGAP
jgi:hypothetical protein